MSSATINTVTGGNRKASPRIVFQDVELGFQNKSGHARVFGPMSAEIAPGETVALVGPSGCGKSSLLKAVIGDLETSSGTIGLNHGSTTKTKLSVVFQENTVFPWLTARENVAYPLRLTGLSRRARDDKATGWLSRVALGDSLDKYPAQLSGGMVQRVALARALAHEPDLLVLDEPFGQIDELTRLDLGVLLQGLLAETQITTLFVTHSIDEAVLISSRIFVLSKGPARLLLDLPNPLGASRDNATVTDTTFVDIRNKVLQTLIDDRSAQ